MKKLWKEKNSFLKKEGEKELIFDLEPEKDERRKSSEKQYIACKYCGRKNLTQKCILLQCEPLKIIDETDNRMFHACLRLRVLLSKVLPVLS